MNSRHYDLITTTRELRATLRAGPRDQYGHPLAFVTDDGVLLSYRSVRARYRLVSRAVRHGRRDGWRVIGTVPRDRPGDDSWPECCAHDGGPLWGADC